MNITPLEVSVNLINEKVQFRGVARDNEPVIIDYVHPIGDGQGYTSLELLLISLASCSATSVATLLRKMRKDVVDFKVSARGIRREVHPTGFEKIFLQFTLTSPNTEDDDMQKALKLSEESICPVWAMLKNNVEIFCEYTIIVLPS